MSVSGVGASPSPLEWLQTYLSSTGSPPVSSSCSGCQPSTDTASISQQAVQLNASQAQSTDQSQTSGIAQSKGHHHHHHHGGGHGKGSTEDSLSGTAMESGAPTNTPSNTTGGSFIDNLAGALATDLLAQYQQSMASQTATSSSSTANQINAVA